MSDLDIDPNPTCIQDCNFAANPLFWSLVGIAIALLFWVVRLSAQHHHRNVAASRALNQLAALTPHERNAHILDICVANSISGARKTRGKFCPRQELNTEEVFQHYLGMEERKLGSLNDGWVVRWVLAGGHLGQKAVGKRVECRRLMEAKEVLDIERASGFQTMQI